MDDRNAFYHHVIDVSKRGDGRSSGTRQGWGCGEPYGGMLEQTRVRANGAALDTIVIMR